MPSFALIACDNGFGHVRRCLLIAKALRVHGRTTLFAPLSSVQRFDSLEALTALGLELVDFSTRTSASSLREPNAEDWSRRLPSLDSFDVVVSDNLIEVLNVRRDAVLSGSFLWHLVLSGMDPDVWRRSESLLELTRPRMIASTVFGMPSLTSRTRLTTVGLCSATSPPQSAGDALLVACGGTTGVEQPFREALSMLAASAFSNVFVEPRLLPTTHPHWMRAATFDDAMYRQIGAAVCRPGVGTMTDCAWAGARVFSVWEAGNEELTFNAGQFARLGIGESANNPIVALESAGAFITDRSRRDEHAAASRKIGFDGVRETVEVLVGLAGSNH